MDYVKKLRREKYFDTLVKFENRYSMGVAIVLALLAIVHIPLNLTVSKHIASPLGLLVLLVVSLTLLLQKSKLVMVLGLFVLYKIYHQSRDMIGVLVNSVVQESVFRKLNTENKKDGLYKSAMEVPETLEEEIVGKVVPMLHTIPKPTKKIHGDFKPVLSEIHGATLVNEL